MKFNALFATTAVAALATAAQADTLRLNHNNPEDHPTHVSMQFMADRVSELTDGEVQIQIFPNGQLGTQRESMELLQNCSLEMARSNASELEAFEESYSAINLPYIFDSEDHFEQVISGEIGQDILAASEDNGFRGVAFLTEGARSFYGQKPILSPADLDGVKVRVQPSPSAIRMVELLGGNPTPISWGELYSALQQGVVDAAENNPTALTSARHGEVVSDFSLDEHTIIPSVVLISNCAWDNMSEAEQEALMTAAAEMQERHGEDWAEASDAAIEQAKSELGVEVHEVDKAPFVEVVQPMYDEVASQSDTVADLIERIQAAAGDGSGS
ncbi:TRAP transporter substrate-binding protein [Roseivivax sediminis]|uniref:Tripartite ATP-independent transporter solute receptor, DctP family n=1 Tax=Roseivivax sediminis TaxID=936889 RepID=A0A1I1YUD3_9RHOB|nr:TRAP transporter substrate-binding protein [Roseivivax sediminis]SFE23214.1 tripartite ATP-independent transporter solute receptor, DctP family [Roseivivax sediminis]